MSSSKYDIVIYGATGFTGKLAVAYVSKQYAGKSVSWAIAGRSSAKLESVAKSFGANCGIIVAEADDEPALISMCNQTKAVVACAGPFARYGKKLVAACVETGTDYCDITGEMGFVREMIALHDDAARKSGARIVHLCGHDSIPWDLSTLMLSKQLANAGGPDAKLKRVDFFTDINSAPSGGTLETAMGIMFGAEGKAKPHPTVKALGFDPLLKTVDGTKASSGVSARNISVLKVGAGKLSEQHPLVKARPHRTLFFMAGVNANAVKRSNALNGYGDNVVYCEGQSFSSLFSALGYLIGMALFGLSLAIPPLRAFMRAFVLPKPGEGPSEESMSKGYLVVTGVAQATTGHTATSVMRFPVDPGYKDTARMVVESALTLALDENKLEDKAGGVFTPGACQKVALLNRLCNTGTSFQCS